MTSIAYDFKSIKHRIDQMNGEATSGTYYRQDESGKVEIVADGHDWIGLLDRCARCGYYVAELHDNLAPKVCPGKIDGEPCSECGKNAVVNLKVATPHFHASRCLACGYLWREYSEAEKARQAQSLKDRICKECNREHSADMPHYRGPDVPPGFKRVTGCEEVTLADATETLAHGSGGHNWNTHGDVMDCTVCGFRPDEILCACPGHKPWPGQCSVCEECGDKSVMSFSRPNVDPYSRCFSCRHSFYPVPAPKRKEWVAPAVTARTTMSELLGSALNRLDSQRHTITNGGNTPTFVFDPATGQWTEIKPGQTMEFDKNAQGGLVKVDPSRPPAAQLTSEGLRIKREATYHDFQSVASGEVYGEARIAKAFGWHSPEHKAFYPQHAENCDCDVCIPF